MFTDRCYHYLITRAPRWEERGAIDTPRRANAIWKKILAEFEAPPMDESIREELAAFVERRKREGGAPTDF